MMMMMMVTMTMTMMTTPWKISTNTSFGHIEDQASGMVIFVQSPLEELFDWTIEININNLKNYI